MKITKDYLKQVIKEEMQKEGALDWIKGKFAKKPAQATDADKKTDVQMVTHKNKKYDQKSIERLKKYFKVTDQNWVLDVTNTAIDLIAAHDGKIATEKYIYDSMKRDGLGGYVIYNDKKPIIRRSFLDVDELFSLSDAIRKQNEKK